MNVGGTISVAAGYDPATGRRVFDVADAAGGNTAGGGGSQPDNGLRFDGDRYANESGDDATQTGVATNLDGSTTFASGRMYLEESYILAKPGGGTIDVFRVEVQGTLVGYITSEPLVAGVNYTYSTQNVTPTNAPDTSDPAALVDVPCFAAGTMISTPSGPRRVEALKAGDLVMNGDGQPVQIKWTGRKALSAGDVARRDMAPVRIEKHALGPNCPDADLYVSPNHRIVINDPSLETRVGSASALVAAKFLVWMSGISKQEDHGPVVYHHFLCARHEVVLSNNLRTESLYPGDMVRAGLDAGARAELEFLFPELFDGTANGYPQTRLPVLRRTDARGLEQAPL